MRLSREAIQRMVGDRVGGGGGAGGGGGISMDDIQGMGFATEQWANDNYVAIPYFSQLFTIHGKQTTTVDGEVTDEQDITLPPNTMPSRTETTEGGVTTVVETTITRIEALFDFNSVGGVSALGYNPGGGGGGDTLTEPLASINNASLGMPTAAGQVITWNGTQWIFDIPEGGGGGGGTVTAITAGTGLSGGTITSAGTISISNEYQTRISHGQQAWQWGNHANAGYLTPTDIADMATKSWVETQGFVKSSGVTSVGLSVPTGFTVSGSPVTTSGTLALGIASGYFMPTTTQRTTWNNKQDAISDLSTIRSNAANGQTAYGWGNHADAGYAKASDLSDYLPLSGGTLTGALHMGSSAGESPYIYWGDGTYAYIGEDADDHITLRGDKGVNILTGSNYELEWNGNTLATQAWVEDQGFVKSSGVTSVGLSMPTGFTVSSSPVTSSGTLSVGIASGYFMPTTTQRTTWNNKQDAISDLATIRSNASHGQTAYGWGNHANAGYLLRTEGMRFTSYGNYIAARFVNSDGTYDATRAAKAQGDGYIEWWSDGGYFNHEMGFIRAKGNITIGTGTSDTTHYLQIGGARLYWDNANNALKLIKADGTACNFYATGGVTALQTS